MDSCFLDVFSVLDRVLEMRSAEFMIVEQCAAEFSFQLAYTRREKINNICLAISRVFLELSQAQYRAERKWGLSCR
jgi:hypothetical protein